MADSHYSVDDILNEIRSRRTAADAAVQETARRTEAVNREAVRQETSSGAPDSGSSTVWDPSYTAAPAASSTVKYPVFERRASGPEPASPQPADPAAGESAKLRNPNTIPSAHSSSRGTLGASSDEFSSVIPPKKQPAWQPYDDGFGSDFERRLMEKTGIQAGESTVSHAEDPADHSKSARAAAFITGLEKPEAEAGTEPAAREKTNSFKKKTAAAENSHKKTPAVIREGDPEVPASASDIPLLKRSLVFRLAVNLFALLGILYLYFGATGLLPMPAFLANDASILLWIQMGLLILSALFSGNAVGSGIISLFTMKADHDSYAALALFGCLTQGAYAAMRPEVYAECAANIYLPLGALILLFNTVGKLYWLSGAAAGAEIAMQKGPKHIACLLDNPALARRLGVGLIEESPSVVYSTRCDGVSGYLDAYFSRGGAEDAARVAAPMTAGAALVMSAVSYVFSKDLFTVVCVFAAALCITAPIAAVLACTLPLAAVNRRLAPFGALLCGHDTAEAFSAVDGAILRCSDLFPAASVTIHGVKSFQTESLDRSITDAASVLCSCESTLTAPFREMIASEDILSPVEGMVQEDGRGIAAWVEGRRVLIGNREMMESYGVSIPPEDFEQRYRKNDRLLLYLAVAGEAAAMYIISYKADKHIRRTLSLLASRDIALCVSTADPNVTAELINRIYGFPEHLIHIIPAALQADLEQLAAPRHSERAALLHNGQPSSYIRAVAAARLCSNNTAIVSALMILSIIVGFALVTFFAFTGSVKMLTWIAILIFQLFWALIQLLLPAIKK